MQHYVVPTVSAHVASFMKANPSPPPPHTRNFSAL